MKKKTIILLLLLVLIALSATIYFLSNKEETPEEGSSLLVEDFEEIHTVNIHANEKLSFQKEKEDWYIEETERETDKEKINHFIESMEEMIGTEVDVEPKEVNLDFPKVTVAFSNGEEEMQRVSIGQLNAQQDQYYVEHKEKEIVYLVDRTIIESIPLQKRALYNNNILSISSETVEEIHITNGTEEILINKTSPFSEQESLAHISGWYMHQPYHGVYSMAYSKMEAMILGIDQLEQTETIIDDGHYGLENADFSITFSNNDSSETLLIGDPAANNHYYAKLAGTEKVYTISTELLDAYSFQAFDLIDQFVDILALEVINELVIETIEENLSFTMEHKKLESDEVATMVYKKGNELEIDEFREVYKELAALSVDEEIEEEIQMSEPDISIRYRLTDTTKEIQFIPISDSQYAVQRGSDQPDFLIATEKVEQLIQMFQEL